MIGDEIWHENPANVIGYDVFAAIDMWCEWRTNKGCHLPCAGGFGDQPALLWDAFAFLTRIANQAGSNMPDLAGLIE